MGRLPTAEQEGIIGRTKVDNVELDDDERAEVAPELNTIVDADGTEHDILRDNMPFGRPGQGEFGTYFIGYASDLSVIERMIQQHVRRRSARRVRSHPRLLDRRHRHDVLRPIV